MSNGQSKVDSLAAAGILDRSKFSEQELALIETMTQAEVDVLIGLRKRLGEPDPQKAHLKPNIIV